MTAIQDRRRVERAEVGPDTEIVDSFVNDDPDGLYKTVVIKGRSFPVRELNPMRIIRVGRILVGQFRIIAKSGIMDNTWRKLPDEDPAARRESFMLAVADMLDDLWEGAPDAVQELLCMILGADMKRDGPFIMENIGAKGIMETALLFMEANAVEDVLDLFFRLREEIDLLWKKHAKEEEGEASEREMGEPESQPDSGPKLVPSLQSATSSPEPGTDPTPERP